jgi:hypothetical protein
MPYTKATKKGRKTEVEEFCPPPTHAGSVATGLSLDWFAGILAESVAD